MLQAVNWSEKLGQIFGGHRGRVLRILILFLCALGVLVVVYRARSVRLEREKLRGEKPLLKIHAASLLPAASTAKWVIVGNPDEDEVNPFRNGADYVCSVASVAREAGWKSVIIGPKLDCCIMPDCYPINRTQFLRMNYRTAAALKNLTETGSHPQSYKEAVRNIAFLWVIHRGARWVFDAYVEEYQSANVTIPRFEEELTRQLHTLALDESLALVQERGRSRGGLFRNPYSHFGRPDVRLVPNSRGSGGVSGGDMMSASGGGSHTFHHAPYHHYTSTLNLAHGHAGSMNMMNSHKYQDFPTFRICEVRPPHIEKFLEIDEGWWDLRAPALVLPGDNMPPLCTRNTLFSPEVFWALPLLPDYSRDDFEEHALESPLEDEKDGSGPHKASRIPPWYIRGLWSQSLLGDLGGSIRLTLSRVPTLQMNQDYFAGGDYEQNPAPSNANSNNGSNGSPTTASSTISHVGTGSNNNRTGSSKLLKRWHCRSRSTYRCLLLMSKELSKSIYLKKNDLSLIEAWIIDLKNIHYLEPPMLPRRRSHTNPCLGADGLHGVSFYPSLEPNLDLQSDDFILKRNETFRELIGRINAEDEGLSSSQRDKRETEKRETIIENSSSTTTITSRDEIAGLLPPEENSTYAPIDWSTHISHVSTDLDAGHSSGSGAEHEGSSYVTRPEDSRTLSPYESYYQRYKQDAAHHHPVEMATSQQPTDGRSGRMDYYQHDILPDQTGAYRRRGFPVVEKSTYLSDPRAAFLSASRSAKHLHEALAKHHDPSIDGFPILKAMAETMCGFGALVPYQPAVVHSDVLLIIAFTNHHYDLIPTLEVLYRASFPNILYCGNPHESVDLFLRKYQSVEHRSFSFLPTYTRATYECVLGAMEMNYEVKGYVVITDETLIKTWNIDGLDKSRIWVSSSSDHENRHVPVTKESWPKLDPRGQKLPRLLDGLANTWKMLTYFLVGQDTYILEPATIKRRRRNVDSILPTTTTDTATTADAVSPGEVENVTMADKEVPAASNNAPVIAPLKDENNSAEKLETLETSYVPISGRINRIGELAPSRDNLTDSLPADSELRQEFTPPSEREPKSDNWDLTVPGGSWSDVKSGGFADIPLVDLDEGQEASNETFSGIDETTDDVEVGEEDDETTDLIKGSGSDAASSSPTPNDRDTDEIEIAITPTSEVPITENSTDVSGSTNSSLNIGDQTSAESVITTTPIPESSVGVPLYHVEHVEPPTPPTYHKPDEKLNIDKDVYNISQASNSTEPEVTSPEKPGNSDNKDATTKEEKPVVIVTKAPSSDHVPTTGKGIEPEVFVSTTTTTSTTPTPSSTTFGGGSEEIILNDTDNELRREMEILLDGLKKVYLNLIGVVQDYQEMNDTHAANHELGLDGKDLLEDSKSHRISPREFRHIRCTMQDDGHQSELCFILRAYVNKLLLNLGTDIHLYHDTIPMYYLPSSTTKPFYSVANVLLHHGVMDELALPLLFRGLAPESEWIKLIRSPSLILPPRAQASSSTPATASTAGISGDDESSISINNNNNNNNSKNNNNEEISSQAATKQQSSQYLHPFHLHKVYSDQSIRKRFCKNYLLRIFQM